MKDIGRRIGRPVAYIGHEEKESFLGLLQEALPPEYHETAAFFLFGDAGLSNLRGGGANRNAVLAAFAGGSFLSFDDDTELETRRLIESSDDVTVTHERPGLVIGGFPDAESMERLTGPFRGDPFKIMESIMGRATPAPGTGTVRAAMAGIYGGRWFSRPFGILFNEGVARRLTYASMEGYRRAKYDPFGFMQSPGTVISASTFFIGSAIGIDASNMVPPFFPQVRNDDSSWSSLLQGCVPGSMIVHLPFAVYHSRSDKKPFTENDFKQIGADLGINVTLLLSTIADQIVYPPGADPFTIFGKALIGLSELPHNKWMDMCRALWMGHVGSTVKKLQGLLEKYEREPAFWARDVDAYLDRLRSTSLDAESFIPRELHAAGSPEEAGKRHRTMLNNFGKLLTRWSVMWREICRINRAAEGLLKDVYNECART